MCAASRKLTDWPMPSWHTVQPIRSIGCGESPPRYVDRFGMRRERLRVFLVALLVDRQVAGHAPVHLRHGLEVHVVDDVRQDELLNLDRRRQEVEERRVEEVVLGGARRDRVEQLAQARLLGVHVLDLLGDGRHLPGVLGLRLLDAGPLGGQLLDLQVQRGQLLLLFRDALALLDGARQAGRTRRLEVVAVVVVGGLRVLIVALRPVEPDVDVVELLLQLVDLRLVRPRRSSAPRRAAAAAACSLPLSTARDACWYCARVTSYCSCANRRCVFFQSRS